MPETHPARLVIAASNRVARCAIVMSPRAHAMLISESFAARAGRVAVAALQRRGASLGTEITSALRHFLRTPPKRATKEPADDIGDPQGEHGCKRDGCRDKPKLRLWKTFHCE